MEWSEFYQQLFYGLLALCGTLISVCAVWVVSELKNMRETMRTSIETLSTGIGELNTNVGILLERTAGHGERLDRIEDKVFN